MLGDCLCNIAYSLKACKIKEIYRCKYVIWIRELHGLNALVYASCISLSGYK